MLSPSVHAHSSVPFPPATARAAVRAARRRNVARFRRRLAKFRLVALRHLVRVYPNGYRTDTSNCSPWSMWFAGASVATLNWQLWDAEVMANLAFFRDNGACGYVNLCSLHTRHDQQPI